MSVITTFFDILAHEEKWPKIIFWKVYSDLDKDYLLVITVHVLKCISITNIDYFIDYSSTHQTNLRQHLHYKLTMHLLYDYFPKCIITRMFICFALAYIEMQSLPYLDQRKKWQEVYYCYQLLCCCCKLFSDYFSTYKESVYFLVSQSKIMIWQDNS